MSSVPPPRCPQHGLALGPEGQCVLCRRAAGSVALDIAADEPSGRGGWIVAAAVVVAAVGVGAWSLRARAPKPQPLAAAPAVAPPAVEAAAKPTAAPQPAEDELAKSLRMLERAEQERRAREQVELARQEEQRAAAALQRERDEKVRDERRHALVQHELDALALSSARRNVNIIMYSTSWCGVCSRARAYMQQRNIPFTDLDVEHDAAAHERQRALNPRGGVPTISIDDDVLIGFSPESLESRIDRAARRRLGS